MEEYVFTEAARDTIAAWGPWADHMLGTVTLIDTDSLNATWRDALGDFTINTKGRMTDGWVKAMDGETQVFAISSSWVSPDSGWAHPDSSVDLRVHKRLVKQQGKLYLVELFDPVAVNAAIPWGAVAHNAIFGQEGVGAKSASMENKCYGGQGTPSTGGTMAEIHMYLNENSGAHTLTGALYEDNEGSCSRYDTTDHYTATIKADWFVWNTNLDYELTASTAYTLLGTTDNVGGICKMYYEEDATLDDSREILTHTPSSGWGATETVTWANWGWTSIYGAYTEPGGGRPWRQRPAGRGVMRGVMGDVQSQDTTGGIASRDDVVYNRVAH